MHFRANGGMGSGIIDSPASPFTGGILGASSGRADAIPMHVPQDAYVIPAYAVSHIGEGNTLSGMEVLKRMFGAPWQQKETSPWGAAPAPQGHGQGVGIPKPPPLPIGSYPQPTRMTTAKGGHPPGAPAPIMASDGEFVVSPQMVAYLGRGDIGRGHKILDQWVMKMKSDAANTIRKLPGPER
jgi:hypothetical protein